MKRIGISLLVLLLICGFSSVVLAEDSNNKGELTLLGGTKNGSMGQLKYQLTEKIELNALYEDQYEALKLGIDYHFTDHFGVKLGVRADDNDTVGYAGLNYSIPFGTNLQLSGFYIYNDMGDKWGRYESAVRIEMYPQNYLYAGIRGDSGSGVKPYDYNTDNEALLFMRGDFKWQFGKFDLNLRPLLYVQGDYFHDYDLKYSLNDRTKLVLNINSLYDQETRYRAGIEFKF